MKILLKKIAILSIVILMFSCSKDSPTTNVPCNPIPCLNGGISKPDCGCNCPQGYTGANCGSQIIPTSIKITKIKVKYFSNYDNGSNWDVTFPTAINALPDIYVTLQNSNNVEIYNSPTYFENVLSNGTSTWDFIPATPISIPFIYFNTLKIRLYDYDGAVSNINDGVDDLMASSIFNIYSSTGGFPTTINLLDSTTPIGYELTLLYTW